MYGGNSANPATILILSLLLGLAKIKYRQIRFYSRCRRSTVNSKRWRFVPCFKGSFSARSSFTVRRRFPREGWSLQFGFGGSEHIFKIVQHYTRLSTQYIVPFLPHIDTPFTQMLQAKHLLTTCCTGSVDYPYRWIGGHIPWMGTPSTDSCVRWWILVSISWKEIHEWGENPRLGWAKRNWNAGQQTINKHRQTII